MHATASRVGLRCTVERAARSAAAFSCSALLAGCLVPTPFAGDPPERDLNARSLARLRQQDRTGDDLTFAAFGDTHAEYDDLTRSVRAINRESDVDLAAHLGDMTDFGLLQEFAWTQRALAGLKVPLFTTIGNHDAISDGAAIYREMYGALDYTFEHRGVAFVFFNSNSLEFPGQAPAESWLRRVVLGSNAARGVVLITHHPPWAAEYPRSARRLVSELLASGKVRLFVHGHLATFQLVTYHGVLVLQCGTFQHRREHVLITLRHLDTSFVRCRYAHCEPVFAERDVTQEKRDRR